MLKTSSNSLERHSLFIEMVRLKFFLEEVTPEIINRAEAELGETETIKVKSLKEIKKLIAKAPDFDPCTEDTFLLRFLRQKKFKVEEAFKHLLKYYRFKSAYSRILTDFRPSELKHVLEECTFSMLEYRDDEHVGVGLINNALLEPSKYGVDHILASFILLSELMLTVEATQILGYSVILNYKDIKFSKFRPFATPTNIYRIISTIQDFIPCRIKAYHIVNEPLYYDFFFSIARKFISSKLIDRVHFHGSDLSSLHQHLPLEILPEELGGKQGPSSNYARECNSRLLNMEDHFIRMSKYGYKGQTFEYLRK